MGFLAQALWKLCFSVISQGTWANQRCGLPSILALRLCFVLIRNDFCIGQWCTWSLSSCAGLGLVLPLCAEEAGTEGAGCYLTQHRHLRINLPIFFGAGEINFCWNSARQIFIVSLSYNCTTNFGLNVAFLNPSLRWSMLEAFRKRVRSGQARSESHFILSGAVKQTILAITIWILSVSAGERGKTQQTSREAAQLIPKCVLLTYQLLNCWQMTSSCNDLVQRVPSWRNTGMLLAGSLLEVVNHWFDIQSWWRSQSGSAC